MSRGEDIFNLMNRVRWQGVGYTLTASFLVAGLFSAVLSYVLIETPKLLPNTNNPQQVVLQKASKGSLSNEQVAKILERNIFNSAGAAFDEDAAGVSEEAQATDEIVKTDLPLKLVGTIYGGDLYSGMAIIENTEKRAVNSFMVGNSLGSNSTLAGVDREKIYINRGNRIEFLEIEHKPLERRRARSSTGKKKSENPLGLSALANDPPPESFSEDGFERKGTHTRVTKAYKEKLLGVDFAKVLSDAKATPHIVGGEIRGYTLTRIREDSIYRKLGFQQEDVVTEINGIPLGDPSQAIKMLNQLRNESQWEVTYERGGVKNSMVVENQ